MAVQQSGNVGPASNMRDRNGASTLPRGGKAKSPQTSFDTTKGMVRQTSMSGIAPGAGGTGPDASSPNVMDPEPSAARPVPTAKWGMTDADGKGVNGALGSLVLAEGKLPSDPYAK